MEENRKNDRLSHLEITRELLVEGFEKVLTEDISVGYPYLTALNSRAVGEDGDDQLLVRAPSCSRSPIRAS